MKTFLFTSALSLLLLSCGGDQYVPSPVNDPSAKYVATVAADTSSIHVEAEFSIDEPLIFMYVQQTSELPDGEASFVKNLVMKNSSGEIIPLKDQGAGDWKHSAERNERVTISYDIELRHDEYRWPAGIDEVSYIRKDGIFFTGDMLFILPGTQLKDISITINVPHQWTVSVPWKHSGGPTFIAEEYRDLINNCGFIGSHAVETIMVDAFRMQLAIGGSQKRSTALFVQTMTKSLRAFSELFGGSRTTDYLVVIHDDVQSDGGAFRSSFSQLIDGEANGNSAVTWGHTMVHEIFHLWNGNAVIPSTQEEWFKEGFTDYISVKYLHSLKILNETNFLKTMENTYRKYILAQIMAQPNAQPISIRDAGNEKAKNRLLVYGGGSLVALMLDVELRERTQFRAGIEQLMKAMYDEFGATGKKYSFDDIIRISSKIAGSDMTWFFDKNVSGVQTLELRPYYTKLGLQLDQFVEEIYLSKRSDASPRQRELYRTIFQQPF